MNKLRLVWGKHSNFSSNTHASLFDSADLGRMYFPGNGVFYSIGIHVLVFAGLVFVSLFRSIPPPPLPANQLSFVHPRIPKVLLYLPVLEPAGQMLRFPAPKTQVRSPRASKAKNTETKGLSYPGPQLIVSDPPNPTNLIQTVLQPDLEKPPILVPPLALPNIVQVADVTAALPKIHLPPLEPLKEDPPEEPKPAKAPEASPVPDAPEPAMVLPALELAPPTRMEAPKIVLPPSIPPVLQAKPAERPMKMELPGQMKAKAPAPEPDPIPEKKPETSQPKPAEPTKPAPAPKAVEKAKEAPIAESSVATKGKQNLLSLTPMPASPKDPVTVPVGEARGRFVISPDPNLAVSEKDPGMKTGNRSVSVEIARSPTEAVSKASTAAPHANGPGAGGGAGNSRNPSPGAGGSEAGRSAKAGSSSGSGNPSGSRAAQGSGKRPFAGITIVGGDVDPGEIPNEAPVKRARRPLQTSYGLSIISTEDSGGGLPFVGVFSNEQIYTVYLDMRQSEMEDDPNWTLEFAVIPGSGVAAQNPGGAGRNQQGLILPFPAEKTKPVLPLDLVRKHLNKMIIVYAIIGTDGRMDQITIEQSPDNQLDEPVFQALSRWVFRPAQLNGEPVAAKVLMGIPLWLSE